MQTKNKLIFLFIPFFLLSCSEKQNIKQETIVFTEEQLDIRIKKERELAFNLGAASAALIAETSPKFFDLDPTQQLRLTQEFITRVLEDEPEDTFNFELHVRFGAPRKNQTK